MKTAAVIVAAGRGTRAGEGLPKQWRDLGGMTVAARTLGLFRAHPNVAHIVLVLSPDDTGLAPGYTAHGDVTVVAGGAERNDSVLAGLNALDPAVYSHVLIHDVARPFASTALISRVIAALATSDAAAPGLPVTDALWQVSGDAVSGLQDRSGLFRAQTPQGFGLAKIQQAYKDYPGAAADDVEVARAAGIDVAIVPGEEDNLKITTAQDFERGERLLRSIMDIRVGNGFDVHRFCEGDAVILCGVSVPHDKALLGHSDADVGMHALTDAIYGALAEGDIGQHFPPSDPQWKGAASHVFLEHAARRATDRGFAISNADVTLICEDPKIGPHAKAMAETLATIMKIASDRVSVKATTSEQLGFTGRREGISAQATATLVKL